MNLGFWTFEFFFGLSKNWKNKELGCVLAVFESCPVVFDERRSRVRSASEPYSAVSNACPSQKIIFF